MHILLGYMLDKRWELRSNGQQQRHVTKLFKLIALNVAITTFTNFKLLLWVCEVMIKCRLVQQNDFTLLEVCLSISVCVCGDFFLNFLFLYLEGI